MDDGESIQEQEIFSNSSQQSYHIRYHPQLAGEELPSMSMSNMATRTNRSVAVRRRVCLLYLLMVAFFSGFLYFMFGPQTMGYGTGPEDANTDYEPRDALGKQDRPENWEFPEEVQEIRTYVQRELHLYAHFAFARSLTLILKHLHSPSVALCIYALCALLCFRFNLQCCSFVPHSKERERERDFHFCTTLRSLCSGLIAFRVQFVQVQTKGNNNERNETAMIFLFYFQLRCESL